MIGTLWDRALADSLVVRRRENLNFVMGEVLEAVIGRPDGDDLVEEMLALGSVVRLADGTVADPPGPTGPVSSRGVGPTPDQPPSGRTDHEVRDLLRAPAAPSLVGDLASTG